MISFCHPTGNPNVRAVLEGLYENNLLSMFHTTLSVFPGDTLDRVSNIGQLSELKRRSYNLKLKPLTRAYPWMELGRLTASKVGLNKLLQHEKGLFSIDAVYQSLDKKLAKDLKIASARGVRGIYGYEDGIRESFRQGKILGLQCLYDLPIGYWRTAERLLKTEQVQHPEWASTLKGFQNSQLKLSRKDEELRLADRIFVASQFTAKTLQDFPGNLSPVEVVPYGFPKVDPSSKLSSTSISGPLKLLFVGGLSQRKGIANLFAAVEGLGKHVELTIVGRKVNSDCAALDVALTKHKWIPSLPHRDILKIMRENDILIFPSLFEGFGLVITEAMSQGTPVITTERTAGPDLIEHELSGWLVEAGSTQALKSAIENILSNRRVVTKVGYEARETAIKRPWEVYGRELAIAIKNHFSLS